MEPVHPIPKRKPSVAALEKLVSDAEEMANVVTMGDNSPKGARNFPKVPAFDASNAPPGATIPALDSRTPIQSPIYSFPNPTPEGWPYVFPDGIELDTNSMEAFCMLSNETPLDDFVFSPTTPSTRDFAFDWPLHNQQSESLLIRSAPGPMDYCNIPPPNRLRGSSLPSNSSPFGMLLPAIPVPSKTPKIKPPAKQFSGISSAGKWIFQDPEDDGNLQLGAVSLTLQTSDLPSSIPIGPPLPCVPDFSSTEDLVNWDLASNTTMNSSPDGTFTTTSPDGSLEMALPGFSISLNEEVEQYVEETFGNCTNGVRESWAAFLKNMISKDPSSKDFWLSRENVTIWASMAQSGNAWSGSEFTEANYADMNAALPVDGWWIRNFNFTHLNPMAATCGRDIELFGMDLTDPIFYLNGDDAR